MKVLCVAEKNSIAKAVSNILSGGQLTTKNTNFPYVKNYEFTYSGFNFTGSNASCEVVMTSVAGHLTGVDFDNQQYGWGKCNPSELFDANLSNTKNKDQQKIAENIRKSARNVDYLMIWTDCDREGEYIGWEIYEEAKKLNNRLNDNTLYRAIFSHLERNHILGAARNPQRLDKRAVDAVGTRIELDLRTGVSFTRLLTDTMARKVQASQQQSMPPPNNSNSNKKENVVVSYGPCQFPTLGFVVDRFERIRNFKKEEFWTIQLVVSEQDQGVQSNNITNFQWDRGHLFDRLAVLTFYELCLELAGNKARVVDIKSKQVNKWRPLPLTTVELQKNCSRYLKMNARDSLAAAEKLYQKGFISYPRTETDTFPPSMDLKSLVEKQGQENSSAWFAYAKNLLDTNNNNHNKFKFPRSGSHDDKAHPPIHPIIGLGRDASITVNERRVYEYVVRHFLASCSEDGKGQMTSISLNWNDEIFNANGLVVLERNWLDVYPWMKWENSKTMPRLEMNQEVIISKAEMKNGYTSPPKPMTESELIMLMDANGIGTDATIAEHIEKIKARKYITSDKVGKDSYLNPTILGVALVHGFETIGLEDSFAKPFQRREMEDDLKKICGGTLTRRDVVTDIINKYKGYYNRTNQNKNRLLQVYDQVKRSLS
ncbi:similar to Saccharomyces cerevisiae YLR234W TOP3 DNA Topoisomerase III [Maudiozyma barnettii]|uniref:DNA topoisomerase n=1 Tax=Maudiozyma barnettii TaxID=61262 RepID=A0A8H2VGR1_9SACH|nr:DNA topoisomerase 3 [Kazachstania barnettii]CAB4255181.1 similar to Saccharomyces cerevisiae YLR234W TOP3 DNA Topoisomerase III [Kazachstania barnettii]CAD1783453.1 similar to Saccharomyces cerevisiae YLR234W TOP3 DNA Topoisomerase III [Kazachstania barnettii]